MKLFLHMLVGLSAWLTLLGHAAGADVEGVLVSENGTLHKGNVSAYRNLQDAVLGENPVASSELNSSGVFRFTLSSGVYFITATGKDGNRDVFAFHGANPVLVGNENVWLPLISTLRSDAQYDTPGSKGLSGQILYKGEPVADAHVSLYDRNDSNIRGLGIATISSDSQGRFHFKASPGNYLVAARKRSAIHNGMPLKSGDLFCFNGPGVLSLNEGHSLNISINCYPKDDLEGYLKPGSDVKKVRVDRALYRDRLRTRSERIISGKVTDPSGKPVPGITVTAYPRDSGKPFQMYYLRLASEKMAVTDAQGNYTLHIDKSGSYFLVARQFGGESPWKGEFYGLFEGNSDHAVTVGSRPVQANLTVSRVMGEPSDSDIATSQQKRTDSVTIAPPVIDRDTIWSGEVLIHHPVLVGRLATLRIMPGTVVRFRKVDRDGDGIGDAEIRVTGRIIAKGTAAQPIRFESAEARPAAGDWSYLMLFTAGPESVIEHCSFSHAFSGVQVHFSRAVVRDSVFTKNREGIRFGRAELLIEHNAIRDNDIGIRYHRLEGPVDIVSNLIEDNRIGMFLVPSSQKYVDSSPDAYSPDPRYFKMPVVRENVISGNSSYNFELGERLITDIPLGGNWWGESSLEHVRATVYDHARDEELGNIMLEPVLAAPVPGAGPRRGKVL